MTITLELLSEKNIKEVFNFEVEHKLFFEKTLMPRPKGYFEVFTFKKIMAEFIEEQDSGDCYMHLIKDISGKMIGRINLHGIKNHKAELGYRIAEEVQGKGIATEAIKKIINLCNTTYQIKTLEAGTATGNIGSQKVLLKNGFVKIGEEKNVMKINDKWVEGCLYSLALKSNSFFNVVIESDRLIQKPTSITDIDDIYLYFTAEVTQYMYPHPTGIKKDIEDFITSSMKEVKEGVNLQLTIYDKETMAFIGCSGLHHPDCKTPELGIWIKKEAYGCGYGKEAIEAIIKWASEHVEFDYLKYPVDRKNIASSRIPLANAGILAKSYVKENMNQVILNIDEYHIYKETI